MSWWPLNGHPVRGSAELRARLGVVPAGDTVELKVQRGKETQVVKARIAEVDRSQAAGGQSLPELDGAALAEVERSGLPGKNRAVLVNCGRNRLAAPTSTACGRAISSSASINAV